MEIVTSNSLMQLHRLGVPTGENSSHLNESSRETEQVTPQCVLDLLPRYTVRQNGAYLQPECFCGICCCKYCVGDKVMCLPCQHNFHDYCLENWLKWVKSTCPVDRKSILRHQYADDLINERHSRILNLVVEKEPQHNIDGNNTSYLINDGKSIPSYDITIKKITKKLEVNQNGHKFASSEDSSPKFSSPAIVNGHQKSDLKQDKSKTSKSIFKMTSPKKQDGSVCQKQYVITPGVKTLDSRKVPSGAFPNKHKESAMLSPKRSLKADVSRVNKSCQSVEFQNTSNSTINLSLGSSIFSPALLSKQNENEISCSKTFKCTSPSRCKKIERDVTLRGIMGNRNLTFSDFVEQENEVSSGWIYMKRSSCSK